MPAPLTLFFRSVVLYYCVTLPLSLSFTVSLTVSPLISPEYHFLSLQALLQFKESNPTSQHFAAVRGFLYRFVCFLSVYMASGTASQQPAL